MIAQQAGVINVQYLPVATVEVEPDGTCTLVIDWSASEQGEWDEAALEHEHTTLSEQVSHLLDAWTKSNGAAGGNEQRVSIGKLGQPLT